MQMETRPGPRAVGIVVLGLFVALVGVATIVGMPWQHLAGGVGLAVVRALGGLLAVGVGAGLVLIALRE